MQQSRAIWSKPVGSFFLAKTDYDLEIMVWFPGNPSGTIQFDAQEKRIKDNRNLNWSNGYGILAFWYHIVIEV